MKSLYRTKQGVTQCKQTNRVHDSYRLLDRLLHVGDLRTRVRNEHREVRRQIPFICKMQLEVVVQFLLFGVRTGGDGDVSTVTRVGGSTRTYLNFVELQEVSRQLLGTRQLEANRGHIWRRFWLCLGVEGGPQLPNGIFPSQFD